MPYSTPDDVRRIWWKVLTTPLDAMEVASLIDDADGIIDGFLAKRYTVPLAAPVPRMIQTISATLAAIDIIDKAPATPDWVRNKLERAWKLLEMIANGEVLLPGVTLDGTGSVQSSTADFEPTFGAEPSWQEHVDWDRQQDEASARGLPWPWRQ